MHNCFSVTQSWLSPSFATHNLQHDRLPCPSPYSSFLKLVLIELRMPSSHLINCHAFSSCPQTFPAPGYFPMSQLFVSGGQNIGASVSVSVLPMNSQDLFPLGLTGLISLQSKELSKVFSNTIAQKYQFFGTQLSLWSKSQIHTWLLENHSFD